jgi:hypothetical protein
VNGALWKLSQLRNDFPDSGGAEQDSDEDEKPVEPVPVYKKSVKISPPEDPSADDVFSDEPVKSAVSRPLAPDE